ncbi:membrane dipeptidase, partial [candidate division KSB1 bacterium]|nr:membrane dipeptidase [candidate division KSB1 bacterium]
SLTTKHSGSWSLDLNAVQVAGPDRQPIDFALEQNYPNPFNPSTTIEFNLARDGAVDFYVHDLLGKQVGYRSAVLPAGRYHIRWSSRGAAGIYFYTLQTPSGKVTRRMTQLDGGDGEGLAPIEPLGSPSPAPLAKNSPFSATLIASRLGYISDTLSIVIDGDTGVEQRLESIHFRATVVDLHNDILERMAVTPGYRLGDRHSYYHTDIPRLQDGGVDIQFFAVWVDPRTHSSNPFEQAMSYIDLLESEIALNPNDLQLARTAAEAEAIVDSGRIAAVIGVEGGHAIENSLDKLLQLADRGMRYLTLTWNNSLSWAVSAQDARSATVGLSDFGRQVVRTLDSLGVLIDVSHVGIQTIEDVLEISTHPVVATHSGARALCNHYRNLTDSQIQALAATGGVIGVVFYPPFLSKNSYSTSIETVIDHIDYIVGLVGIDHVALGSDFDGIERTPAGLADVTKFPDVTLALLRRGYSIAEVEKILGGNFMRVFHQVTSKNTATQLAQATVAKVAY